jgi:hypothetical protein
MQADYAVELGRDDPALEIPWQSEDGSVFFYDLKNHPAMVYRIPEAAASPELSAFLARINAPGFPLATAKCDAWYTRELAVEEGIFSAPAKFVSYVDLVFTGDEPRLSLEKHEALAERLCELLERAPEMTAAVELVIRRCYFHAEGKPDESADGYAITVYVSGFGEDEDQARKRWSIALTLTQHALVQAAR